MFNSGAEAGPAHGLSRAKRREGRGRSPGSGPEEAQALTLQGQPERAAVIDDFPISG